MRKIMWINHVEFEFCEIDKLWKSPNIVDVDENQEAQDALESIWHECQMEDNARESENVYYIYEDYDKNDEADAYLWHLIEE